MKLETIFGACSKLCRNLSDKNPERGVDTPEGKLSLAQLAVELDNLCNWCYKGDIEVQKITRCKNCIHYKRYKKKDKENPYKHDIVTLCRLDKIQRSPDFFCSNGEEDRR